ncbi:hypothetical protein KY284_032368 [Solanum tuberosum]|nr:hypothetical protein KY284_032368 [Solanum tuberosum]
MGFDMREDEEEVLQQNHNMTFSAQRGRGRGNNNFNSRGRGFKPAGQGTCSYNSRNGPGPQSSSSSGSHERNNIDACQIYGRNNHTALKCFYRWDYSYQAADELSEALTATNLQNTIDDTLYVDSGASSHMTHNSVSKLAKDNCCTLEFDETKFVVKDKKTRTLLAKGTKRNGLYALEDNNLYALTATHDWNTSNNMWHTRLGHPSLKSLKCDGDGEFIQTDFIKHLEDCGIVRHISCPNSPEQNEVAERKHRHIVETSLTLLLHVNLPLFLRVEAFLTAVFLINRLPSSVLKMVTPFVKLYGEQLDYNSLKAHDKSDSGEVQAQDKMLRNSSSEEHVALTGPTNEHHQTTILVNVLVDHQSDNATLHSTTLVDVPIEVLLAPRGHHMITRHKAKEHHL